MTNIAAKRDKQRQHDLLGQREAKIDKLLDETSNPNRISLSRLDLALRTGQVLFMLSVLI